MKSKFMFDNCYTHTDDPQRPKHGKGAKGQSVNRRTQTYEKDTAVGYDPFEQDQRLMFLDQELAGEIDEDYVRGLVAHIIASISDRGSDEQDG